MNKLAKNKIRMGEREQYDYILKWRTETLSTNCHEAREQRDKTEKDRDGYEISK